VIHHRFLRAARRRCSGVRGAFKSGAQAPQSKRFATASRAGQLASFAFLPRGHLQNYLGDSNGLEPLFAPASSKSNGGVR